MLELSFLGLVCSIPPDSIGMWYLLVVVGLQHLYISLQLSLTTGRPEIYSRSLSDFSTLNYKKNPYLLYRISTTMNGLYTSFCMFGLQWQKFAEVLSMVINTMTLILLENLTSNFLMLLQPCILIRFKPSLSMKVLSINHFIIKLFSDLSIGVHLKSSI